MDAKLKEGLEEIFKRIEKSGFTTQSMREQKDNIIGSMSHLLSDKLDPKDLTDPAVQMRVVGAMVCKALGLSHFEKGFMDSLEKNPKAEPTGKEKPLMQLLKMLDVLKPENKKPDSMVEQMIKKLKELVMSKRGNKDKKDEKGNEKDDKLGRSLDNFDDQLGQSLRILEGGKDPRNADSIAIVVLAVVAGEQFNTTKEEAAKPGASFLDDLISYDPQKPDYTGGESQSLMNNITNGISSLEELNASLGEENKASNASWPPRPQGPGQLPGSH